MYIVLCDKNLFCHIRSMIGKASEREIRRLRRKPVGTNDSPSKLNKYAEKTMLELHVVLNNKKVEQD